MVDSSEPQANGDVNTEDAPAGTHSTSSTVIGRSNGTNSTPRPSFADSPAPDDQGTPQPARVLTPGAGEKEATAAGTSQAVIEATRLAEERDRTIPSIPLHQAIIISIEQAAKGDDRKMRDYFGGILPIGGGSQIPMFKQFLEEELAETQTKFRKDIMVAPPPREMDPQVLVWKGASVFGKLKTNDSWISAFEYDRQGIRTLLYKCLWNF